MIFTCELNQAKVTCMHSVPCLIVHFEFLLVHTCAIYSGALIYWLNGRQVEPHTHMGIKRKPTS